MRQQVGTVNILEPRVYPRDPGQNVGDPRVETVSVNTGLWPVYLDGGELYWEMSGHVTHLESRVQQLALGPGLLTFGLSFSDVPTRHEAIVRSKSFSLVEFGAFLTTDPTVQPGVEQRLLFDLPGLVSR